jgi:hypothetical protein
MLYRWLPWLLFFGVFSWTPAPQSKPSDRGASRPFPLELILRADRSMYRMSDTLRLETQLRNISNEDIYIWQWDLCWNPARGLTMWIIGADGKTVQGSFFADCVPPPPRSGDPYQFVKVGPGNLYGLFEDLKLSEYLNKPGEYDIYATFNSFLSADFVTQFLGHDPISKLPLWTMERPTIISERIHITVNPEHNYR